MQISHLNELLNLYPVSERPLNLASGWKGGGLMWCQVIASRSAVLDGGQGLHRVGEPAGRAAGRLRQIGEEPRPRPSPRPGSKLLDLQLEHSVLHNWPARVAVGE